MSQNMDLSIVMPCLNEAETIGACVRKALKSIVALGLRGEVVVADNGSTDDSVKIARELGACVVPVPHKGYGNALRGGIEAARGRWIIMGDADDSYDFSNLEPFLDRFRQGYDLVMGCRMPHGGGKIMPGAMPWKHRWIGNPLLSFVGRLFFGCPITDFHCGLRGFTKAAYEKMELKTTGMEFASEMVIKAAMLKSLKIVEVPITLHRDGRSRPPHLKPWRDGWRHLRFMLLYSPRWLFLMPGLLLSVLGLVASAALSFRDFHLGTVEFNVGTLAVACMTVIIGFQLVAFAFYTKVFAIAEGLLPEDPKFARLFQIFTLEKGIIAGLVILLAGILLILQALWIWRQAGFGSLSPEDNLRRLIPAVTLVVIGVQTVFSSFFMSALGLKTSLRRPSKSVEPPS